VHTSVSSAHEGEDGQHLILSHQAEPAAPGVTQQGKKAEAQQTRNGRGVKSVGPNQRALGHHARSASPPVGGKGRQQLPDGALTLHIKQH